MIQKRSRFQRNQRQKASLKKIIFGGLFFCFLVAVAYCLFFSPLFWIRDIQIDQVKNISSLEIEKIVQKYLEKKIWRLLPQKNIFLVPVREIEGEILDSFPALKVAVVQRVLPNGLTIKLEKRKRAGIWCQLEKNPETEIFEQSTKGSVATSSARGIENQTEAEKKQLKKVKQCFYIDQEGIIYQKSPLVSGSMVINIYSHQQEMVNLGQKVALGEVMNFILSAHRLISEIETGFGPSPKIVDFEVVSSQEIIAATADDWQIYLNPAYSIESQVRALEIVLNEEVRENYQFLEYADLRIEGRVYYRLKNNTTSRFIQ